MKTIYTLVSIIFLFSSCSLFRYSDPKLRRKWMLTSFENFTKDSLIAKKASLDMTEKEFGKVYMGCNEISYNYYNKRASDIYFKGGLSSTSQCTEMSLEDKFNLFMQRVVKYKINGHNLELITNDDKSISFIASDWD